MKKQRNQVIALGGLIVAWALCWVFFIRVPHAPAAANNLKSQKSSQAENPLKARFRRVRSEMDALYHYRLKPAPFDAHWNPFRIPGMTGGTLDLAPLPGASKEAQGTTGEPVPTATPPDFAESLLKRAVAGMRIGGVVTLNGTTQLTVDGQLHKEGDVFAAKIPSSAPGPAKSVLIRVKHLSTTSVTMALEETEAGGAEIRIRIN